MISPNPRIFPWIARLLLAAAAAAPAYVGQWHSYSDKSRVNALVAHQGFVYAGTQGGIRRVQSFTLAQKDFGNLDGLIDPWITGFAIDGAGTLWAAAHDGYLYALAKNGVRWEIHGRSYAAESWIMNDRAMLAAGTRLFLGSRKGLTIFDTEQKISRLNLTRFGNDIDVPVLALLRHGDTLYAGTSAGVYKARAYFADPLNPPAGYANLGDHNQWIKAVLPFDPARKYNHLAFIGDSLATFGPGTLLQADGPDSVRVEAFSGAPLQIGSQTYPGSWNDYTSALRTGGKVFAGGASGLAVSAAPAGTTADAAVLAPLRAYPRDTIANIGVNRGVVWGHSNSGIRPFSSGSQDFGAPLVPGGEGFAIIPRALRNVKVDVNGDIYVGTWGDGLNRFRNGEKALWKTDPGGSNCIFQAFPPNDPWTVVFSLSQPTNSGLYPGLYFAVFRTENSGDHQLVHFNTATEAVTCVGLSVPGGYPHTVHAFSDSLLGVGTDVGIALFKTREGPTAPQLESEGTWTVAGGANEAFDMAVDFYHRPWAVIGGGLARLDLDSIGVSTTKRLVAIESFVGTNCKSLEADPAGSLWAGCSNGLFHLQTDPTGELSSVRKYGLDDGLPSLTIYDVSVDPSNGYVWVATDRGVGMFESSSQPAIAHGNLDVIYPYPNPLKPQHAYMIFPKLPSNSTLRIHDATGHAVRIFHPRDLKGNEAQWDGKNEKGKAVAPGVYLFSVTSGSKVQRGKVIVAR